MATHSDTFDDRLAAFALESPISWPTRIEAAIPMAKGKLKKINVAIVNVMMCASNATVPSNPANIVVISNDHASHAIELAPDIANFQNGLRTE